MSRETNEIVTLDHDVVLPEYHFHAGKDLSVPSGLAEMLIKNHGAKRKIKKRETAMKAGAAKAKVYAPAEGTTVETPEDKK